MKKVNQTILTKLKQFNLQYCVYNFIFSKTKYKYDLIDENNNIKLKLNGFKRVKYSYDFEKNKLKF